MASGPRANPLLSSTPVADRTPPPAGEPDSDPEPDPVGPGKPVGGRAERRRRAKRAKNRRRRSAAKEIPILVVVALMIALLLKTFVVQPFSIPSGSMENTIQVGDRVVVDKFTPWFGSRPSRGDVVVFRDPGGWLDGQPTSGGDDPPVVKQVKGFFTFVGLLPSENEDDLIKRVIGVGGDTVACCDRTTGRITVNGYPVKEPYLHPGNAPSKIKFRVEVPEGRLFVMGDHRSSSADSRYHLQEPGQGTISEDLVVGRAMVVAWPLGHWRGLDEPGAFAAVPDPDGPASAATKSRHHPHESTVPPVPAELPLVMTVMGVLPRRGVTRRTTQRSQTGAGRRAR